MKNLGISGISNVRIGKHITLEIDADTKETATEKVEMACQDLLSNPIMESFEFKIEDL